MSGKAFTLSDLRAAKAAGRRVAMLTCYDYTTATWLTKLGIQMLLVGDTAASIIFGHPTTLPASLELQIELTAAVKRGAPLAWVLGDMPFGSYHAGTDDAMSNVTAMVRRGNCDSVKLEVAELHLPLIERLAAAGVAVVAHIGLRPQAVQLMGYRTQGKTPDSAAAVLALARQCEEAGAAAVLVEAVPADVGRAVAEAVAVPVIGCGAGPGPCGDVVVLHDLLKLTPRQPSFVPDVGSEVPAALSAAVAGWLGHVERGSIVAVR